MVNLTKFAIKGAATIFIISILAALLGYIVRFLLARNLAVEDFGLFYAVFAFLSLIGFFKSLGLDSSLIKFIPEFKYKNKNDSIKSSIIYVAAVLLTVNLIIIAIIYLLSNYLSINFFHDERASQILKLLAFAFFIDSFVIMLKYIFQGYQEMAYFSGVDLVRMALLVAIIFIGFKLKSGFTVAMFAYISVPILLLAIFMLIFLRKTFPEFSKAKFIFDMKLFKKLTNYGIFIMSVAIGGLILGYTDTMVLTYFTDLKAVALYNIAFPTANVLVYFPRAVNGVLLPLASELWAKKQKALLRAGVESLYKYSLIVVMPIALAIFSFSELVISVLYGESYVPASLSLKILVIGMIVATLYGINANFFSGIGKPQIVSKILYIGAIFNLVTNLILIPIIGIVGAAITTTVSYFIMMVASFIKIRKFIDISVPFKIWVKTLAAGAIFILIMWLLKKIIFLDVWLKTSIVLAISGVCYIALLFLLRIISISEIKNMYKEITL